MWLVVSSPRTRKLHGIKRESRENKIGDLKSERTLEPGKGLKVTQMTPKIIGLGTPEGEAGVSRT